MEGRLREEIVKTLRARLDEALADVELMKEAIGLDMKRWKTQRADLQIEIGKVMQKVEFKPD